MSILFAEEKDISALVSLMDNAYRGEGSKQGWTSEADLFIGTRRTDEITVKDLMKKTGTVFLKYVNDENKIEGCVFLHKKGNRLYLGMLSVSPIAQAKGVGSQLLAAAEEHARNLNCSTIYMTVISVREELIAWYERKGYKKTGQTVPFPVDERFGRPTQVLKMLVLEKTISF